MKKKIIFGTLLVVFVMMTLKYQNGPEPTFFLIFILHRILNLLRMIKFTALFAILAILLIIFGNSTASNQLKPSSFLF